MSMSTHQTYKRTILFSSFSLAYWTFIDETQKMSDLSSQLGQTFKDKRQSLNLLLEFVVNCGNPLLHNQNSLPPHPTTPPTHSFTGSRVHSLRFFVNQWIILHAKSVKNIRPTVRAIVLQSVVFCCCRFGTNLLPAWPRNASVTLNYSRLQF